MQNDADARFYMNILKMELERVKYVLKSYLRIRVSKIERHLFYIIEKDLSSLLSRAEVQFAFDLYEARKTHFKDNMFEKIPKKLNFMDLESIPDQYSKLSIL